MISDSDYNIPKYASLNPVTGLLSYGLAVRGSLAARYKANDNRIEIRETYDPVDILVQTG